MKKKDVLDHFGSVAMTARALRISVQAVYKWGDDVPGTMQYKIQVLTKGKLKVDGKNEY